MSRFHYEVLENESEFENLVCDLFNAIHETSTFELYRNRGNNQYGVDMFSREKGIVIQCKKKDPSRKDRELKLELINDLRGSVTKSLGLPFDFKIFVLATTAKKYSQLQDLAIQLTDEHPFTVQFLAWGEIEKHLHHYPSLRKKYYPHLQAGSTKQTNPKMLPAVGTIGANPLVKASIQERFNKLGKRREKRFGKNAWKVMYRNFKNDFKIRNQDWTCIWEWPETTAATIREYLEEKLENTIAGRISKSREKPDYIPTRPQLFAREKEALSFLGIEMGSDELKVLMHQLFGVTSHTKLSHLELWMFTLHLEGEVRKLVCEE